MKTLLTTLLSFIVLSASAAVYNSDGTVQNIQAIHNNQAVDGDLIMVPAGTFSWTARLNITKGITIQGATTIAGAGTANPIINDATIVLDDTPRTANGGIIRVTNSPSQSFRLTGITFRFGTATTYALGAAVSLNSTGNSAGKMRVDHCHFDQLYANRMIWTIGWLYGVADNNVMHLRGSTFGFLVLHNSYGGSTQTVGNGSWADYPWYGTDKFWFIETNTIIRVNATFAHSLVDSVYGGRWVARHNYLQNVIPQGHGTEGGNYRGQRVNEFYDNTVNITVLWNGGGQRGGTNIWHDNVFIGREPPALCRLANYRTTWIRNDPVWGISDGTSVWDRNDTEGNGTYVEGHPPFLFDSGTDTSSVNSQGVMHDSTKNWIPNQWVGYSLKNLNPNVNLSGYIISNTSNTITYWWGAAAGNRQMIFNTGDTYEMHRVLTVMDGCGMGKGDQVTGNSQPINTTTGTPFWTHEATEPCYSWNNVYSPNGHVLGFKGSGIPILPPRENIEYFNLGGGFPADTTPAVVSSRYTAALNGVDYTGTFTYPHPLVSGNPNTDFNHDGKPDYVLYNASTHQTAIWYLNNNVFAGSAYGPTLPAGWGLASVADFNRDTHPDYALFNPVKDRTAIWYLSGPTFIGDANGPTLPGGWALVAAGDFNGGGNPDYVLYKTSRQTAIWYMNNAAFVSGASGPTLPVHWSLVGVADFNADRHPDYLLFNPSTHYSVIWYLSGATRIGSSFGPTIAAGYNLVGTSDFNRDGKPDYLLFNPSTRQTAIWYMDNAVFVSGAFGPTLPVGWSLVAPSVDL